MGAWHGRAQHKCIDIDPTNTARVGVEPCGQAVEIPHEQRILRLRTDTSALMRPISGRAPPVEDTSIEATTAERKSTRTGPCCITCSARQDRHRKFSVALQLAHRQYPASQANEIPVAYAIGVTPNLELRHQSVEPTRTVGSAFGWRTRAAASCTFLVFRSGWRDHSSAFRGESENRTVVQFVAFSWVR